MALQNKTPAKKTEPAWKKAQQKQTTTKNNDQRDAEKTKPGQYVTVVMKSDYRDVAKVGDRWETDREKAEELVTLGRAEYVK
jgi:hypothetical protein